MTSIAAPETPEAPAPTRSRVARPRTVLIAALVLAALSVLWSAAGLGGFVAGVLVASALFIVIWSTAVAMRRGSTVLAPLAVIVAVVCNPVVFTVYGNHLDDAVGRMTLSSTSGIVFWAQYPGIVGWEAPDEPVPVNTTALVRVAQTTFRDTIDALSAEFSWSWRVGEVTGVSAIPNGFGGDSMFHRVDMPVWSTSDFDGSEAQRDRLLDEAADAAAQLALPTMSDAVGDIAAGDGVRVWTDDLGGTLTLTVQGGEVSLAFTGGPYLGTQTSLDDYLAARAYFDRFELPEPLFVPELP